MEPLKEKKKIPRVKKPKETTPVVFVSSAKEDKPIEPPPITEDPAPAPEETKKPELDIDGFILALTHGL